MMRFVRCCLFMLALLPFAASADDTLTIAAAADLAPCIEELNRAFARQTGADIKTSIGSSGNFYAQIKGGAPFDVFLSADLRYPNELIKAGHADAATLTVYAHGQLVLWAKDANIDVDQGFRLLTQLSIQRIAIANPDVAPYGRAAKAALEKAGIWHAVQNKLVLGENIAQTAQFVQSGNAQVGFISAAHAGSLGGRAWRLPANAFPLMEQGAVVTAAGRSKPLAYRYIAFLRSNAARAVLSRYGFALPEQTK